MLHCITTVIIEFTKILLVMCQIQRTVCVLAKQYCGVILHEACHYEVTAALQPYPSSLPQVGKKILYNIITSAHG